MFLKIIHKLEGYLCCYQKRSYTESIGRCFSTQYLCAQKFSMSEIVVEGFKIEQSRTK